jgi:hypothetical protein
VAGINVSFGDQPHTLTACWNFEEEQIDADFY